MFIIGVIGIMIVIISLLLLCYLYHYIIVSLDHYIIVLNHHMILWFNYNIIVSLYNHTMILSFFNIYMYTWTWMAHGPLQDSGGRKSANRASRASSSSGLSCPSSRTSTVEEFSMQALQREIFQWKNDGEPCRKVRDVGWLASFSSWVFWVFWDV